MSQNLQLLLEGLTKENKRLGRERAHWNIWGKIIVNSNEGHIGAQAIFFQFYCGFENLKIKKKLEKLEFFSTESILKEAK